MHKAGRGDSIHVFHTGNRNSAALGNLCVSLRWVTNPRTLTQDADILITLEGILKCPMFISLVRDYYYIRRIQSPES